MAKASDLPLHEFETANRHGMDGVDVQKDVEAFDTSDGGVSREAAKQPPVKATWVQMATVMIGDVVGVGVLSLASALSSVGWVLGCIMLVGFFPLNAYSGILLSRTRALVPKSVTMSDMAYYTLGKWASFIVGAYIYMNVFFILGDYLLVTGQALGMANYDVHICKPVWAVIAACIIWCIMQFSRTLHYVSYLCWINMACITISVFIAIIYLFTEGKSKSLDGAVTHILTPGVDIKVFFGALSTFLFAYSGQFMYLELMSEMKHPEHFPRTFTLAGPYQLFMFTFVSTVGYSYKGNKVTGFIINNIPFGSAYVAAAVFLFIHMLVTWQIKGQVLCRAIHVAIHPSSANDTGVKGSLVWALITAVVLALNWLLSSAIPFFDYFTSLLGSLQALPTLAFPAIFFIAARRTAGIKIGAIEWAVLVVLCLILSVFLVVFGMWSNIENIIDSYSSLGGPFSCQCHDIWQDGCKK